MRLELAPPPVVYCLGLNYAEHAAEGGAEPPPAPDVFLRTRDSLVGHREEIWRPVGVSTQLDYEVELGVVIRRTCHRVAPAEALDYVLGYTVFNDGSVRDYQKRTRMPTAGKNFHRSGSLAPWLVSADEIPDPQSLRLTTRVNGEVLQSGSTSEMVFDVRSTIAYLSEFAVLRPGDVVGTGTPAGVGFRRTPPRFLEPGDRLELEIERIGTLENRIVDEPAGLSH